MDANMAGSEDDGRDRCQRRLVPYAQKDEGRNRQARYRHRNRSQRLIHPIKPLSIPEIADPGNLMEDHQKRCSDEHEDPGKRGTFGTDGYERRAGGEHLVHTFEREQDPALTLLKLLISCRLPLCPSDVGNEERKQECGADDRKAKLHCRIHASAPTLPVLYGTGIAVPCRPYTLGTRDDGCGSRRARQAMHSSAVL